MLRKGLEALATAASMCGLPQMPYFSGCRLWNCQLCLLVLELEFIQSVPLPGASLPRTPRTLTGRRLAQSPSRPWEVGARFIPLHSCGNRSTGR